MDCKHLREILHCYVDGELSPESMASAEAHVHACRSCARAVEHVKALRAQVRHVVASHTPPSDLQQRVQHALRGTWRFGAMHVADARWAIAAGIVLLIGTATWAANVPSFKSALASVIDGVVLHIHDAGDVDFDATLLCRDCELEKRHGIRALCPTIGHHGALATSDGRIWSIVEQPGSTTLIHNSVLLGSNVRVSGRIYRSASSVSIRRYEVLASVPSAVEGPAVEQPARSARLVAAITP
jgi:hypothetical protein